MSTPNSVLDSVRKVANKYGIPEWIWRPIMELESGGNSQEWNMPSRNGNTEDSRGLFQINVMANPQYKNFDLFDPSVNADIAFKDFISPAYAKVKSNLNMGVGDKAAYVWKEGIRPAWTQQKNEAVRAKAQKYFSDESPWWAKIAGGLTKQVTGDNPVAPDPSQAGAADPTDQQKAGEHMTWFEKIFGVSPGSVLSKLESETLSGVLLIVGLILLIMTLKSMLLGGGKGE